MFSVFWCVSLIEYFIHQFYNLYKKKIQNVEDISEDDNELSFVDILIKRLILLDLFKNENLCGICIWCT